MAAELEIPLFEGNLSKAHPTLELLVTRTRGGAWGVGGVEVVQGKRWEEMSWKGDIMEGICDQGLSAETCCAEREIYFELSLFV